MLKRPILIILLGYIIGIILGLYCKWSIALFVLSILFIYKAINMKNTYRQYIKILKIKKVVIILLITIIIGYVFTTYLKIKYDNKYKQVEKETFIGIIDSGATKKEYCLQYKVKILKINENKNYKNTYILLNYEGSQKLEYGDKIEFTGEYKKPSQQRNYKGFNYKKYLMSQGIFGTISTKQAIIINANNGNKIKKLSIKISEMIQKRINDNIKNTDNKNLILGILIGKDDELDKNIKENFSDSSISHILAISGMHVSYVILIISTVFGKIGTSKKKRKITIIAFLVFFMYLTNETVSVKRAVIMTILQIISTLLYRKNDITNTIAITVLVILIQNPFSIYDIGFLLSFSSTIGIITISKIRSKVDREKVGLNKKKKVDITKIYLKLKEILMVSLSAQIFIFPLIVYIFNKISLTFLISNLLISLFIGSIILVGIIFIIIPIEPVRIMLEFLVSILIKISEIFSNMYISKILVITPNIVLIIIYYLVLILLTYIQFLKRKEAKRRLEKKILTIVDKFKCLILRNIKLLLICIICILIIIQIVNTIPKDLRINFIDVGQGDSVLIRTPQNKTILIDGGGSEKNNSFDIGKQILLPYLLDRKINKIDYLIISHFDSDHVRTDYLR